MSRFPETFAEAVDQVVIGESLDIEELGAAHRRAVLERQAAVRSDVASRPKFPVTRTTPVSGLPTQEIYHLIGRSLGERRRNPAPVGV